MLNNRELATVLAALRHFQANRSWDHETLEQLHQMDHFAVHSALDDDEIDALCERLNCHDVTR